MSLNELWWRGGTRLSSVFPHIFFGERWRFGLLFAQVGKGPPAAAMATLLLAGVALDLRRFGRQRDSRFRLGWFLLSLHQVDPVIPSK